ncbi:putative chromosome segregation protein Cse1 [Tothia fuscella]|uniref:Chromosome segregation protein Cse1 n=1 Tax=Tothia fuscella TaxID=1048955 RepID=A0A9P4NJ53_9PEZI|nr:putative chromosome segregation protein Cse1 [Tothia fuscella]
MAELQAIAQLIEASQNPTQTKEAEAALRQEEAKPNFSILLLHIVATGSYPNNIRLGSALCFKNFIRRNWTDPEGNYKLPQNEVVAIKSELIGLMTTVPPTIQTQLGEAISLIADSDFYERWDTLVDDLVSRLTPDNAAVNNGVLQVAHSIFKRWRPLFRSDDLFTEINHVLSKFCTPFLALLEHTDNAIEQNQNNKVALQQNLSTLSLILKLFYDLSCQDLPPLFEEQLPSISGILHKYLVYDNPLLHSTADEAGVLEYVKAGIFEVLTLYVQKYEDVFGPLLPQFTGSSWHLLTGTGSDTKYDILVSRALQFLTSITKINAHAQTFNNVQTLNEVVERVILPNLALRESDVELFEDEPIEFIRRDLEGSDSDTRRRAATDFLRQLMEQFEKTVTDVVTTYINHYLSEYAKDKAENWKSKDTAVYLFCSIAVKGTSTTAQGVKNTNQYVNVLEFFEKNIAEDLTGDAHPILQVDAIKYLYVFRSQLTPQFWQSAFPLLVQRLDNPNYVIYTYAAIAVERALYITTEDKQPIIPKEVVLGLSKDLLQHLFKVIQQNPAPEKIQENEFLMRCVMRVLIVIREGVVPITDIVLRNFINITMVIRHNPSNPRFYYYHFEGIGALVRFAAPSQPEKLENALYDPFAAILQNDVQEFTPYVFQLFAALLEANPSGTLSEYYTQLIQPILMPTLWESKGNVPALVRLLAAIIPRGVNSIIQNNQIEPILGIFQKLITTKVQESHGFDLIEAVVANVPAEVLRPYFRTMLELMLNRLSNSKTENFGLRFVRFYHLVAARDERGLGTDYFIRVTDEVQNDVFRPVYTTIILPDTQKLTRPTDRKTAVISFTKTLANSEAFITRYSKGWSLTCEALLKLLINPPIASKSDDVILDQDVDDLGFGVGFTQLNTTRKVARDAFPEIAGDGDIKGWVGQYLKEADERTGGRVGGFVRARLSEEARAALGGLMG